MIYTKKKPNLKSFTFKKNSSLILGTGIMLFSANSYAQQFDCDGGPKSDPLTKDNKCKSASSGGWNNTVEQRISSISNVNVKQKYRSVFVNQSINKVGGFAVIVEDGNDVYLDANGVGSTFAVDGEDGDCIYEREDELLSTLKDNGFDELILYDISDILRHGDKNAISSNTGSYKNIMGTTKSMEWHLARFIKKAKNWPNGGFEVVASIPQGTTVNNGYSKFYQFYLDYGRSGIPSQYDSIYEVFNQEFLDQYMNQFLNDPSSLTYKDYGEDTLFLPKDNQGRISNIDKYIVDSYNFNLFQYRVTHGMIQSPEEPSEEPCNVTIGSSCQSGFDAQFFEKEWWNADVDNGEVPDQMLDELIGLMNIALSYRDLPDNNCFYDLYVPQDELDDPSWPDPNNLNRTAQQRADMVDELADRIYLYSYHNNPCDCYWGRANTPQADETDFFVKLDYFANNGLPNDGIEETTIIPTFNAKYYDEDVINNSDNPSEYNDGRNGCAGISACDWCYDFSGNVMNDLKNNGYPGDYMAYVENVFQEQYDFDPATDYPNNSDNSVEGYCWFKSSILQYNEVVLHDNNTPDGKPNYFSVYPNPSSTNFTIQSGKAVKQVNVYNINGQLIKDLQMRGVHKTDVSIENSGIYIIKVIYENGEFETGKIIKK